MRTVCPFKIASGRFLMTRSFGFKRAVHMPDAMIRRLDAEG
jgi:hypothetical protein